MAYFREQIGILNEGDGPIAKSLDGSISEQMQRGSRYRRVMAELFFQTCQTFIKYKLQDIITGKGLNFYRAHPFRGHKTYCDSGYASSGTST